MVNVRDGLAFDLKTAGLRDPGPGIDRDIRMPRFTLSADHERAYVRLGSLKAGSRKNGERGFVRHQSIAHAPFRRRQTGGFQVEGKAVTDVNHWVTILW